MLVLLASRRASRRSRWRRRRYGPPWGATKPCRPYRLKSGLADGKNSCGILTSTYLIALRARRVTRASSSDLKGTVRRELRFRSRPLFPADQHGQPRCATCGSTGGFYGSTASTVRRRCAVSGRRNGRRHPAPWPGGARRMPPGRSSTCPGTGRAPCRVPGLAGYVRRRHRRGNGSA